MPKLTTTKQKFSKNYYFYWLMLAVSFGLFLNVSPALAADWPFENWIKHYTLVALAWLLYGFFYAVGMLFINILHWLSAVASWNHFIDVPTVIQGWVIVRDLSNMFFVLVLLVIAFATILRVENYSARRLLPKLLLMALLINFSRTICGLIIDASQVVMLTFVAGFSNNGINNLVDLFGLKNMVSMVSQNTNPHLVKDVDFLGILGGLIVTFLAIVVAMITIIVLLAVLVWRVIMLWLYVVLSPLAFLLSTFPAGARYASMWWQEFTRQIIIGPVLAFFLWLALATAQGSSGILGGDLTMTSNFQSGFVTELFNANNFQVYIITLGLLLGGLIVSQQLGGAAGSIAGRGLGSAKNQIRRLTGARYVGERWGAFQAKRESARKAKVEQAGQRLYGAYSTGIGASKAGLAAGYAATIGKATTPLKRFKRSTIESLSDWRQQRASARQHLEEAFERLNNVEENAEIFAKDGFRYIRRGNKVEVRDNNDRHILTKGPTGMDSSRAFKKSFSSAALIKDKIAKEKVSQTKGRFANFSLAELRRLLTDVSASAAEKRATALMLAEKEGFQNQEQFMQAKQSVNSLPSLAKEFNKEANKRYGYWNSMYRDSSGQLRIDERSLSNKIADGTIKVSNLDTSQLDNEAINVIARIRDVEFADDLKKMARTSQDRQKLKKVLEANISQRKFTGTDLDIRKTYAFHLGGDIDTAFYDANKRQVNYEARQEALRNAKAEYLANISRQTIEENQKFQEDFVRAVNLSQLKNLERSGKSPEKLRKYIEVIARRAKELGREDLLRQIEQDNTLNSILQNLNSRNQDNSENQGH